jgi:hypothetical protein
MKEDRRFYRWLKGFRYCCGAAWSAVEDLKALEGWPRALLILEGSLRSHLRMTRAAANIADGATSSRRSTSAWPTLAII